MKYRILQKSLYKYLTFSRSLDNFEQNAFERVTLALDKEKILALAQRYILKGQSNKAIQEYLRLIEAAPKDKRLYLKLGDLYLKNAENGKAIKEYLKLADLYAEEDLNFRAISIYKRILSINPKYVEAFHKIAKLYLKEGLVGSARSSYQGILEIKPDDQEALKTLESIGNQQEHKGTPETIGPAEPVTPEFQYPAEKEITVEKPPTSAPLPDAPSVPPHETEISPPDKDSEVHYHLGIAYKEMELLDFATTEFELASSDPSIKFDCYIMLGSCFMDKKNYDKSIEYYKRASEIRGLSNEKLARLNFNLGLAYEAKGMISDALDTFSLVLKLDRSFSSAQERINKLLQK
jgi:tetratricopeptide (TPR) repeat protein